MKKLLKISILLLICTFVLLSGCGAPKTSLPSELAGKTVGNPDTLNIIAPEAFWERQINDENAENAKQQWQEEMSARYGVEINLLTNSYFEDGTQDMSAAKKITDIATGKETFSGLLHTQMAGITDIIKFDRALPLEEYLADNRVWNALPDEIKKTFEVNGHIYAIPTNISYRFRTRLIVKDTLEQTGIDITDLDSLKEYALAYTKSSGDYVISSYGTSHLNDIFNAFGLYNDAYNPISYDPIEECYVDFLTKDAAIDALEYLRELNTAGALKCEFTQQFKNNASASNCYNHNSENPKLKDSSVLLTLNPEYPQVLQTEARGFYMTKNTVQPKETINFFVNMLFGSEQNYLDCWLGSSDGYTINSDGSITVNMAQNSDGTYVIPARPDLTGGFSEVFPYSDAKIVYSQDGVITANSETVAGRKNEEYEMLHDALEKGVIVKVPLAYSIINSTTYYTIKYDIIDLYQECIQDAIKNTNWTVEQIVADYREKMLNMGGNAMLDEMNAAIGKKTAYYYG